MRHLGCYRRSRSSCPPSRRGGARPASGHRRRLHSARNVVQVRAIGGVLTRLDRPAIGSDALEQFEAVRSVLTSLIVAGDVAPQDAVITGSIGGDCVVGIAALEAPQPRPVAHPTWEPDDTAGN